MKKTRYHELRAKLYAYRFLYRDIAERIGKSVSYVSLRFEGKSDWTVDDAYLILEMIDEPAEKLSFYFPPEEEGRGCKQRKLYA